MQEAGRAVMAARSVTAVAATEALVVLEAQAATRGAWEAWEIRR